MVQLGPFSINGYIELPDNHPWLDYLERERDGYAEIDVDVHGGITHGKGRIIGFDTAHWGDGYHPDSKLYNSNNPLSLHEGHVWTWEEVEGETRKLADSAVIA